MQKMNKVFTFFLSFWMVFLSLNTQAGNVLNHKGHLAGDKKSALMFNQPTITGISISEVTATGAKINYTLSTGGSAFNASSTIIYSDASFIELGRVSGFSAGGSNTTVTGSIQLTGLEPGRLYNVRIEAVNNANYNAYAGAGSFTTLFATSVISSVGITNLSDNTAQVNFSVRAGNANTSTIVRYGTNQANLNLQVAGSDVSGNTTISNHILLSSLSGSTTYYYQIEATNSAGTTTGNIESFTTLAVPVPVISAVSISNIGTTGAQINYSLNANNNPNATSLIRYGTNPANLTQQVAGFNVTGNSTTPGNIQLVGLQDGVTYYYQIEATNNAGTSNSTGSFKTLSINAIVDFTFDNTLSNTTNSLTFAGINSNFANNRNLINNKAITLDGTSGNVVNIPNIPLGSKNRTISLWYKVNSYNGEAGADIFQYGNPPYANQSFGYYLSPNTSSFYLYNTDKHTSVTTNLNQWYHVVLVLTDQGPNKQIKVYRNNVLIIDENVNGINTGGNGSFTIGNKFIGAIDDLKIFDRDLTATEVENLYHYNDIQAITTSPNIAIATPQTTITTATLNYSIGAGGAATTSVINYGLANNSLTSQKTGFNATATPVATTNNTQLTGLQPNTTYYYQITATNANGSVSSNVESFSTQVAALSTISAISVINITGSTVQLNYSLNANETATSSIINYGLTSNSLTSQTAGFGATGTSITPGNTQITGLQPGTLYHYEIVATNAAGNATSSTGSFTTLSTGAIAEFSFDNTLYNTNNAVTFTGTATYTTDRHGNTNSAVLINGTSLDINTIANLPQGSTDRTISIWYKMNSVAAMAGIEVNVFNYGAATQYQKFGLLLSGGNIAKYSTAILLGHNYNDITANDTQAGNWYHAIIVLEAATAKIYINKVLIKTVARPNLNTTGVALTLAGAGFVGALDDLKIFNRALTATEVENLYNANNLQPVPTISQINTQASYYSTSVAYTLNANGHPTTSVIKYGLSPTTLIQSTNGFSTSGNTNTTSNTQLTGLQSGITYYYQIEAINNFGTSVSNTGSFTTISANPIIDYTFDNTLNNIAGNVPFTGVNNTYTTNRNNVATKALLLAGASANTATIANLPLAKTNRTISLWYKVTSYNGQSAAHIFSYGNNVINQRFHLYAVPAPSQSVYFSTGIGGVANIYNHNTVLDQWYHVAVVLTDQSNKKRLKIYFNNVLQIDADVDNINTAGDIFTLGDRFIGAVDDLKVYDRALSTDEIGNLYLINDIVPTAAAPEITTVSHQADYFSANINYTLKANVEVTTSVIKYGLANNNLSNQVAGFGASGTGLTPGSVQLSGLEANTTYFYQIESTNSLGTVSSSINSFKTKSGETVAEFTFDNTLYDIDNNITFDGTANYTNDRHNQANKAFITGTARTVTIPDMPRGDNNRTISFWYKMTNAPSGFIGIFSYGNSTANQMFGFYINSTNNYFQLHTHDKNALATTAANTWYHLTIVLTDQNNKKRIKVYRNGFGNMFNNNLLIDQDVEGINTGGNGTFKIEAFTGAIDDLKIYDRALDITEVSNLFNHNLTVLPVTLVSFTAKAQNNSAILNWETAAETNNSHFVIKRSTDGTNFSTLTTATAKSTNGAKYQFIDNNPLNGTSYYQLLQVDLDGKTTDLGAKALNFGLQASTIRLFPNPTTDKVEVTFAAGNYTNAKLTDINGRVLQNINISKLQQSVAITLGNYPKGLYLLQLIGDKEKSTQKIIKQ